MTLSAPFKVEKEGKKITLIGYGAKQRKTFFAQVSDAAKNGKIYQLKLIEVTAAEVHRNYVFMCISLAAEQLGYTPEGLRAEIEDRVFHLAMDEQDDYFKRSDWIIDVVDIETQEVKKQTLRTMSHWSVSMMNDFFDVFKYLMSKMLPNFTFPDPKEFSGIVKGARNEILNVNDVTVFEF